MKLTNYIREAFINSVMADVPEIDYNEQIQKLVMADIVSGLPAAVAKVYKDPQTREYLGMQWGSYGGHSMYVPGTYRSPPLSTTALTKVEELKKARVAQEATLSGLQAKMRAAAYGCTTRKALAELLPEFERYLPAKEEETCRTLPAVANLMADMTKAGWPKKASKKEAVTV